MTGERDDVEPEAPGPAAPKSYSTEQFAFVDESLESSEDLEASGWLHFMNSRAGRRADRRERARERTTILAVVIALAVLVGAVMLWSPWSSGGESVDTGHDAMGADRVTVLFQLQAPDGSATLSGLLMHDRRGSGRGALVPIPADLVLTVGGSRETVRSALAQEGPTLTREAISDLLGIDVTGSWVMDDTSFASLVDSLGGVDVGGGQFPDCGTSSPGGRGSARPTEESDRGTQVVDGRTAVRGAGCADGARVLEGLVLGFPGAYQAALGILDGAGVLPSPGLTNQALAAVLAGAHRGFVDGEGKFGTGSLVLNPSGNVLDPNGSKSVVVDLLGGQPGSGPESTPRILVQLAPGSGVKESDVSADVLNAGYEYVDGGAAAKGAASVVLVRPSTPDAQALGESIATTLGLPRSVVRLSDDVPFTADVLVVLGADRKS